VHNNRIYIKTGYHKYSIAVYNLTNLEFVMRSRDFDITRYKFSKRKQHMTIYDNIIYICEYKSKKHTAYYHMI
jgi:hypothetical protein